MEHAFHWFLAMAAAHSQLAVLVVALVAFAESLAIVGTLVPAAVTMFGAGALAGHGVLDLRVTLACAAAGAVLGDALSYELGRAREASVRAWPIFRRHATRIARAESFLQRHGGASIVLARFTGAVRAFVPLLAGFAHMPRRRFYLTNIVSALLWAPAHILPGVLFGTSLKLAEAVSGRLVLILLTLAAVLWAGVWIATTVTRWMLPRVRRGRLAVVAWARPHRSVAARALVALLDPAQPGSPTLLLATGLLLGAGWLFFGVLEDVLARDPLVQADAAVFAFLQQLRTDDADRVMVAITELGSVGVLLPLVLAVLAWLLWRRCWRTAGYWVGTAAFAELLVQVLKFTIGRHRPALLYAGTERYSFPSGHATVSMVVLGMLAFLLARGQPRAWRVLVTATVAVYVALVAFSRLYLGAHWFSDVLGGVSLGLGWLAFLALVYTQRRVDEPIAPRALFALAAVVVAVAGTAWAQWHGQADRAFYARVEPAPQFLDAKAWASGGWRKLPQRRTEIAGELAEPLPVQVACTDGALRDALAHAGWQAAPGLNLRTVLLALAPGEPLEQLPALPRFDGGLRSAFVLERVPEGGSSRREVVRLWRSPFLLGAAAAVRPLWYGAVYVERRSGPRGTWLRSAPGDLQSFARDLGAAGLQVTPAAGGSNGRPLLALCPAAAAAALR